MQKITQAPTHRLIVLFILLDAVAFVCYHFYLNGTLDSRFFRLGRDRGLFEVIEYFKFYIIIAVFWHNWRISSEKLMKAWAVFFIVMLIDNAVGVHEELGELLAHFAPVPDLGLERSKDVAELAIIALLVGPSFGWVVLQYFQASAPYRQISIGLVAVVGTLGITSLTLDALHSSLEEYVEIFGMTAMMAYIHLVSRRLKQC